MISSATFSFASLLRSGIVAPFVNAAASALSPLSSLAQVQGASAGAAVNLASTASPISPRDFHSGRATPAPQYGGYLRTGQAASNGPGDESLPRFLVTGACGQIGTELVSFLRKRVGVDQVLASDVKTTRTLLDSGPFVYLDIQDKDNLTRICLENGITYVVHLATLLSAVGERNPQLALKINTAGIHNVLDLASTHGLQVFAPSTIAVFGKTSPRVMTPDDTVMQPNTMYGVTKVHQELLGQYYHDRFGVDYRSLRYPGIISAMAPPGGGTTDYAVEIFHAALKTGKYTSFLGEGASLPMMYMPDCLEATWKLMMAPAESLTRTTYNVTAMSFSPAQLADAIKAHIPGFEMSYTPDFRDEIAKTWPDSLDDTNARRDWGWEPKYNLARMTEDMLIRLREKAAKAAAAAEAQVLNATAKNGNGKRENGVLAATSNAAAAAAAFPRGSMGAVSMPTTQLLQPLASAGAAATSEAAKAVKV